MPLRFVSLLAVPQGSHVIIDISGKHLRNVPAAVHLYHSLYMLGYVPVCVGGALGVFLAIFWRCIAFGWWPAILTALFSGHRFAT